MFEEAFEKLNLTEQEAFRRIVNWLLAHTYLLQGTYAFEDNMNRTNPDYLFVERNIVPIERLHKLQTVKGPLDRFFRVAKVVVTTAGGDVTIRFLEEEKAEAIAESLRNRINQIVKEERNAKEQAADGQA